MALFNGLARVNILSTLRSGQAISNTFHIAKPGASAPPDFTDLGVLATDIAAWFETTYRAVLTSGDTMQKVTCYQVTDPTAIVLEEESSVTIAAVGTGDSNPRTTPDSISAIMSIHTPNASRRFRGHLFLPGQWYAGGLDGDKWLVASDTWRTNALALVAKFSDGLLPSVSWTGTDLPDWNLAIYSKAAALASVASVANANACVLDEKVHWLRSRERGAS